MLDVSSDNITREIDAAERVRDDRIFVAQSLVKRYHTTFFNTRSTLDGDWQVNDPENYSYQFAQTIIPSIVFQNPVVKAGSRRTGAMEAVAAGIKQGVNRWVKESRFHKLLRQVGYDSLFPYGTLGIFQGKDPWPEAARIAQEDFFFPFMKRGRV